MRKIQKTISLEPMTSRLPSVLPSYKMGSTKLYCFDDSSLRERQYEYPSNYGMIPVDLVFQRFPMPRGYNLYSSECTGNEFRISFETLSKWYSFFMDYYHLLNHLGHCNRIYNNAVEYYNVESMDKYASQMAYGSDKQTYVDMDRKYASFGGKRFFTWIRENVIPTYVFMGDVTKYKEYWKTSVLYYPDIIKWIAWFKKREGYLTTCDYHTEEQDGKTVEIWNCKQDGIDCCDCEEYFNRGGINMYNSLVEWYNSVQENIEENNDIIRNNEECFKPHILTDIEIGNSLDDLGQFSIFSKEYELGKDYRTAGTYGDENTHGGTVAEYSGETMILQDGKKGFCFDKYYMEKVYSEDDWENYTDKYIHDNPNEFIANGNAYYAYDINGNVYYGKDVNDIKHNIDKDNTYPLTEVNSFLIDDTLYDVNCTEYGVYNANNKYLDGKAFFVYREEKTNTPYTLINGKKVYGDFDIDEGKYSFPFFSKKFGRGNDGDKKYYITYNDKPYILDGNSQYEITIGENTYTRINGYSYDDKNNIMYTKYDEDDDYVYDASLNKIQNGVIVGNNIVIKMYDNNLRVYSAKTIKGKTRSKLTRLESTDCLIDDIGNSIDGKAPKMRSSIKNFQPQEGATLDMLYQVGNVANINVIGDGKNGVTKLNLNDIANDTNYFIGDIITDMLFYYKDIYGNKLEACDWENSSLETISNVYKTNPSTIDDSCLYCDIEYYIGATLKLSLDEKKYELAGDGYNYGVRYTETVKLVKEPREYYFKAKSSRVIPSEEDVPSNNPITCTLNVYAVYQETEEIIDDESGEIYNVPIANFETEINLVDEEETPNYANYDDMDERSSIRVAPTYKEEYMIGISSMNNVDSDIYIERGSNAAFEKHLKLGEVTSLEDLVQYGNQYFTIMDN